MAYADFSFYVSTYYGDVVTEQNADRWLERASEELDAITFGRLISAYPVDERSDLRIRKAVCAMAEVLCRIDEIGKANAPTKAPDGSYRGAVASLSSGGESITYATGAKDTSAYAAAASSEAARVALLKDTAARYLSGVPDANGTFLLYAGYEKDGG